MSIIALILIKMKCAIVTETDSSETPRNEIILSTML